MFFPESLTFGLYFQLEAFCISVVKKIKDAFGWPDDVIAEKDIGAWTGKLPSYLRKMVEDDSIKEAISAFISSSENIDAEIKISAQDIASYQALHVFLIIIISLSCFYNIFPIILAISELYMYSAKEIKLKLKV